MDFTKSRKRKKKKKREAKPPAFLRRWTILSVVVLLSSALLLNAAGKKKQPEAEAIIAGTVFQSSGHLLRGAKVEVVAQDNPKLKSSAVTDAQGDFAIRVPAGQRTYAITASAKGFEPAQKTVEVYESEKVRANLLLNPAPKK